MAKKSRRARKRSQVPRLTSAQLVQPGTQGESAAAPSAPGRAKEVAQDLREEYRYVATDLRRIAIIAAVMLAVMITLALVAV